MGVLFANRIYCPDCKHSQMLVRCCKFPCQKLAFRPVYFQSEGEPVLPFSAIFREFVRSFFRWQAKPEFGAPRGSLALCPKLSAMGLDNRPAEGQADSDPA